MNVRTVVNESDTAPAGMPNQCFWCKREIGKEHDLGCSRVQRAVKIRFSVELIVDVPRSWDAAMIEFHRNDSSWCANNILPDIERHCSSDRCICPVSEIKYVGEATEEEAVQAGMVIER